MSKSKLNIREVSTDDLLSQVVNVSIKPRDYIEKWLEDAGIEPGLTRTNASKLFAEFHLWMENNYGNAREEVSLVRFGRHMGTRFKRTRSKDGYKYWIRRK